MLNTTSIEKNISKDLVSKVEIQVYNTISSTNDTAKEMNLPSGKTAALIAANHQSQGRGRMNRTFHSPQSAGIYMTMLMPALPMEGLLLATPAAAVAAARAIEKVSSSKVQIKWVNDLYLGNAKVGGILTEAVTDYRSGAITHLAVGIGINCIESHMPSDSRNIIGSLNLPHLDRNILAAEIFNELSKIFAQITAGDTSFMDTYRSLSNIIGKKVTVYKSHMDLSNGQLALARDIDNQGNLVVEYADGSTEHLSSGEVSVRK